MTSKGDLGWRLAALAMAWLLGVALHLRSESLAGVGFAVAMSFASASAVAVAWLGRNRWPGGGAFFVAAACVGGLSFSFSEWRASWRMTEALSAGLEGEALSITGVVADLPQQGPTGVRFLFRVEVADRGGEPVVVPALLSVGWYEPRGAVGGPSEARIVRPRAGERWRFSVRLRRPHGNMNPHGFDQELKLFEQGIGATAVVRDRPPPQRQAANAGSPVQRLRQAIRDAIDARMPDPGAAGMLSALAIGDQGAIPPGYRQKRSTPAQPMRDL